MEHDHPPALLDVEVAPALQDLIDKHPLPAGVLDADMNQEELAMTMSQSVNTIAKWLREGMPAVRVGRNGSPYVLRLSHCHAWVRAREAERELRNAHNRAAAQAYQAELLGLDLADPGAQMTSKERREMAEADLIWNKAARDRRELVQMEDVRELLVSVLSIVRDGIEAMPDRLERELQLKPEQVTAGIRVGRDILAAISERITAEHLGTEEAGAEMEMILTE